MFLSGCACGEKYHYRVVCTDFSTPWGEFTYIVDGMVGWRKFSVSTGGNYNEYYRIPEGHICKTEKKAVMGGEV